MHFITIISGAIYCPPKVVIMTVCTDNEAFSHQCCHAKSWHRGFSTHSFRFSLVLVAECLLTVPDSTVTLKLCCMSYLSLSLFLSPPIFLHGLQNRWTGHIAYMCCILTSPAVSQSTSPSYSSPSLCFLRLHYLDLLILGRLRPHFPQTLQRAKRRQLRSTATRNNK